LIEQGHSSSLAHSSRHGIRRNTKRHEGLLVAVLSSVSVAVTAVALVFAFLFFNRSVTKGATVRQTLVVLVLSRVVVVGLDWLWIVIGIVQATGQIGVGVRVRVVQH
jgi:hypothetical protein